MAIERGDESRRRLDAAGSVRERGCREQASHALGRASLTRHVQRVAIGGWPVGGRAGSQQHTCDVSVSGVAADGERLVERLRVEACVALLKRNANAVTQQR